MKLLFIFILAPTGTLKKFAKAFVRALLSED